MLDASNEPETSENEISEPESSESKASSEIASYELLTDGLMGQILPKLRMVQEKLDDITKHQDVVRESLERENEKVSEWNVNGEISTYMAEAKHYHSKLLKIRKDMIRLSEKSTKMKQKSEELQKQKQKDDLKQQELRRSEMEKERNLVAKQASRSPH